MMMRHKDSLLLFVAALAAGVVTGCAKQGYPSGGPVDRTPPTVLSATPPSGSIDFAEGTFTLSMDEYVTIKDADNNILVSPPMKQNPEYVVRGRKVVVHMYDTLQENTTYLFQFKGAVVDFNEGNPLQSYEYVFSTGEVIDSMTLRGRVVDALTLKASKDPVSVMAYDAEASDSAVVLEHPRYYTRCDTGGYFAFNHIAAGAYRLVAFLDGDRNLRLNPGESTAFLDSAVTAQKMPRNLPKDTLASAAQDSTARYAYIQPDSMKQHQMRLSLLKVEHQRVTSSKALADGHFQIVTSMPLTQQYSLTHLMGDNTLHLLTFLNTQGDTLDVWTAPVQLDSIVLLLTDDTVLHDTITLQHRKRASGKRISPLSDRLKLQSLVAQNHPYYDTLHLRAAAPVSEVNAELSCQVMNLEDSTVTLCPVRLLPDLRGDSTCAMKAMVDFVGKAGGKYKITLPSGMLSDVYGHKSDSLTFTTTYTKPENYGSIALTVETARIAPGGLLLVQLLNEKGDVMKQVALAAPGTAEFPHLKGGKYSFRLVNDTDGDGQWTAGDYWLRRQPEEVVYTGKILELRENWEMTERFHW